MDICCRGLREIETDLFMIVIVASSFIEAKRKGRITMSMEQVKMYFDFNEVKLFMNFNEIDEFRLKKIHPTIKPIIPKIVKIVIKRIADNPKLVGVMQAHSLTAETAQSVFEKWLNQVFSAHYNVDFAERAYEIAETHERAGIHPKYVTLTMSIFIMVVDYVISRIIANRKTIFAYQHSVKKALFLNMIMISQSYEEVKRSKVIKSLEYI